jgi:hypothetical protein
VTHRRKMLGLGSQDFAIRRTRHCGATPLAILQPLHGVRWQPQPAQGNREFAGASLAAQLRVEDESIARARLALGGFGTKP